MPFTSTAQQRWAFATDQPFAERWADETDFSTLPARQRRKMLRGRRRLKAMTRSEAASVAARARWDKFRGGSTKPPRGRRRTTSPAQQEQQRLREQERQRDRQQDRTERRARAAQREQERQQDRADRRARLAQRDRERQQDRQQRQADRVARELERRQRANKPRSSGGGGDKNREQAARESQRRAQQASRDALRAAADRRRTAERMRRERQRQSEQTQRRADQSQQQQRQSSAQERRDAIRQQEQRRRESQRRIERGRRDQQAAEQRRIATPELADATRRLSDGKTIPPAEQDALIRNGLARRDGSGGLALTATGLRATRQKSVGGLLTVFKDAQGRDRWLSITTTAYEDKDREWISRRAIAGAVTLGDQTGQRGPLRFWHVPGLDFGTCDYQATAQDGRFLIESGTCASPQHAAVVKAAAARGYQMSPGFVHPLSEPHGGVYESIAIFERSFLPPGRASNPWTRLMTKERRMLTEEKRKELESLAGDDEGRALLAGLLAHVQATDKAASQQATYKDAPPWAQALIGEVQALGERVKAVETKAMPPMAEPEMETEGESAPEMEMDDGPVLTQADADLIAQAVVTALAPVLNMEKKMASYLDEMKGMLGGSAQKDDARAQAIAALQQQQAQIAARLKELEGDLPDAILSGASLYRQSERGPALPDSIATQIKEAAGGTPTPAGLSPTEQAAYRLIYGQG